MHVRLAAVFLAVSGAGAAAEPPDHSGTWKLNPSLSQDVAEKIKAAAGPASMSGGVSWATETWIPWTGGFGEKSAWTCASSCSRRFPRCRRC